MKKFVLKQQQVTTDPIIPDSGGLYTPGFPVAGSVPNTFPLTGNELIPADTQLTQGLGPQTEAISVAQLIGASISNAYYEENDSTTSTETTPLQIVGIGGYTVLQMTGTLSANSTLLTPLATDILAQLPNTPRSSSYILRIENMSSANFSWTLTGNVGVEIDGNPVIPQNTFVDFIVDLDSFAPIVFFKRIGSGST